MQCCNNLLVKIINGTVVAVLGKVTRITYISFAKLNVSGNTIGHCISLSFMCQMCLCPCQDSQRAGSFFHDDCIILNSFNRRKRINVWVQTSHLLPLRRDESHNLFFLIQSASLPLGRHQYVIPCTMAWMSLSSSVSFEVL